MIEPGFARQVPLPHFSLLLLLNGIKRALLSGVGKWNVGREKVISSGIRHRSTFPLSTFPQQSKTQFHGVA